MSTIITLPWSRIPLLHLTCLVALCWTLIGCSAAGNAAIADADQVHTAWVQAIREGDSETALTMSDPELPQRELFVQDAVNRMQDYLHSPASPTGPLQDVRVEPVAGGEGRSIWQFAQKRWCYRTALIQRDAQWYVNRWGQTSVNCP